MDSQEKLTQKSLKRKLPPSITSKNDAIMRNRKVKWTKQEEEGLIKAVNRYGTGPWKIILQDPDFSQILAQRSNVDLKDKWRNIINRGTPSPITKEKPIPLESCNEAAASTPSPSLTAASTPSPSLAAASTPSPSLAAASTPSPSLTAASTPSPSLAAASTPSPSLAAASTPSPSLAAASTPSSSIASKSAKEAETVLEKTENTDSVLQLVKEHLEKDPRTRHVLLSFLNLLDGSK